MHNINELVAEIADLNADVEQYKAMLPEHEQVKRDKDPYKQVGGHGMKVQLTTTMSYPESLAINRADYITRREAELQAKRLILAAIQWVLQYLTTQERTIHMLRHVKSQSWRRVESNIRYNERHVRRIEQKVVDDIIFRAQRKIAEKKGKKKRG